MTDLPSFKIGPILEYYGFDPIEDGYGWRTVRCAFHNESSPSASVRTDDQQVYVCHGCGMKGNAAQIIMKKEDLGYWEAVRRAEGIAGASDGNVRQGTRSGNAVPGKSEDRQSFSSYKRTWLRE